MMEWNLIKNRFRLKLEIIHESANYFIFSFISFHTKRLLIFSVAKWQSNGKT